MSLYDKSCIKNQLLMTSNERADPRCKILSIVNKMFYLKLKYNNQVRMHNIIGMYCIGRY